MSRATEQCAPLAPTRGDVDDMARWAARRASEARAALQAHYRRTQAARVGECLAAWERREQAAREAVWVAA